MSLPPALLASRLASSALPRLLFVGAVLLGAPVATRAVESRIGYVRWHAAPGESFQSQGLEHVGASRPTKVLLHLQNLGNPPCDPFDARPACTAGDVDRDGHDDLWVLSALGPGMGVRGGIASLVSGRTGRILRRMRQVELRAWNLSIENTGDVDGDGVDDLLLGQVFPGDTRLYWVRSGADGRLILNVQRHRTHMLAPVVAVPLEGERTQLAVGRTPRDVPTAWTVDLVDPWTGMSLGPTELPPAWTQRLVDLGDLDGDGEAERGGWSGDDHESLVLLSSTGRETRLVRRIPDGVGLLIDAAGDLDADGVPDVLVESSDGEDLWVLSGASLADR